MGQLTETCKLLKLLSDCYWVGPFSNGRVLICILKILLAKNLTESFFNFTNMMMIRRSYPVKDDNLSFPL